MSIARAFTTRKAKAVFQFGESHDGPQRSRTVKGDVASRDAMRAKISAPLALVHTTNMLSYNAPDIHPPTPSSSASDKSFPKSDDDSVSDAQTSSPPTSPDTPFPPENKFPASMPAVEPNHLSCYFKAPGTADSLAPSTTAPVIPKRAPSHRKPSEAVLSRKRSESRMSERSHGSLSSKGSFAFSRTSSTSTNTTISSRSASVQSSHQKEQMPDSESTATLTAAPINFSHKPVPATTSTPALSTPAPLVARRSSTKESVSKTSSPFGRELAQVKELAEDFTLPATNAKLAEVSQEEQEMVCKGLRKFRPEDYISEISGLLENFFSESRPLAASWI